MHRAAPLMSPSLMERATFRAQTKVLGVLEQAQNLLADNLKPTRLAQHQCKACFYGSPRIGGAAMTSQPCMCCNTLQTYGSTSTDVLCLPCAKDNQLCKHCGGDLEMDMTRKTWPRPFDEKSD